MNFFSVPFLEWAKIGMCSSWNVLKNDCVHFGMCPMNWLYVVVIRIIKSQPFFYISTLRYLTYAQSSQQMSLLKFDLVLPLLLFNGQN